MRHRPDSVEVANNLRPVLGARANQEATLGNQLAVQGKLNEAIACYRRALELKPDFAEAHNNLGTLMGTLFDWDQAVACYQRATELKPDYAEPYRNLGVILERQGKPGAAAVCFLRAAELQPDFADGQHSRGIALRNLGNVDEALASFQKALEINPQHVAAHSSYLLTLQYHPGVTLAQLAATHREFDERHAAPLAGHLAGAS